MSVLTGEIMCKKYRKTNLSLLLLNCNQQDEGVGSHQGSEGISRTMM